MQSSNDKQIPNSNVQCSKTCIPFNKSLSHGYANNFQFKSHYNANWFVFTKITKVEIFCINWKVYIKLPLWLWIAEMGFVFKLRIICCQKIFKVVNSPVTFTLWAVKKNFERFLNFYVIYEQPKNQFPHSNVNFKIDKCFNKQLS